MTKYDGKEVIVMACSSCNIKRCEHCYISYKGDRDSDELYSLVESLNGKYKVYINGAEVLIDKEYFKSYEKIGQNWFLTNGVEIYKNPEILLYLKNKGIKIVEMSYHFGIQDKLSVTNNQMLNRVIEIIKQYGLSFKLLTTINSGNYNMTSQICDQAIQLGAYAIEFTNFLKQGNAKNMLDDNLLTEEQKFNFFEELRKLRSIIDKSTLIIDRSGTFGVDKKALKCNFNCPAGTNSVVLTPDNNIYLCIFLAQPGLEIGKYIDDEIILDYDICNDGRTCLADVICNKQDNSVLQKILRK